MTNLDLGSLNLAQADIHTVASILKLYLRNLPEPLVQTELYPRFLNAIRQRKFLAQFILTIAGSRIDQNIN